MSIEPLFDFTISWSQFCNRNIFPEWMNYRPCYQFVRSFSCAVLCISNLYSQWIFCNRNIFPEWMNYRPCYQFVRSFSCAVMCISNLYSRMNMDYQEHACCVKVASSSWNFIEALWMVSSTQQRDMFPFSIDGFANMPSLRQLPSSDGSHKLLWQQVTSIQSLMCGLCASSPCSSYGLASVREKKWIGFGKSVQSRLQGSTTGEKFAGFSLPFPHKTSKTTHNKT